MEALPKLSFCDILSTYVCLDDSCKIVVRHDNLKSHLQRKHRISQSIAKKEAEKLLEAVQLKVPSSIADKYYQDPLPEEGQKPLPALPLLPLFDISRCPCCLLYFDGYKACKTHMRSAHGTHSQLHTLLKSLARKPFAKVQPLFGGSYRFFFPVTCGSGGDPENTCDVQTILTTGELQEKGTTKSDQLSLRDKSANLTCCILVIPEFLESQHLTLSEAYELTKIDRATHSGIVSFFMKYIGHFTNMQPAVPMPILEGIKIRNGDKIASSSLSIEARSKKPYAEAVSRFLQLIYRLSSGQELPRLPIESDMRRISVALVQHVAAGSSASLGLVHSFFRGFLLQKPRASMGEPVLIENLFKLLMAGYTCGLQTGRVRVRDSDDASHTTAALQYFCHLVALGEFFVTPIGFCDSTGSGRRILMVQGSRQPAGNQW